VVRQYFDEKTGTTAAPNTRLEFATSWRGTANSRLRREFGHNSNGSVRLSGLSGSVSVGMYNRCTYVPK
jgi:hypothetical protein